MTDPYQPTNAGRHAAAAGPYADVEDLATEYHPGGYGAAPPQRSELYGTPPPAADIDPRTGTFAAPTVPPQAGPAPVSPAPVRVPVASARATVGGHLADRERTEPPVVLPSDPGRRPPKLLAGRHSAPTEHLGQLVLPRGWAGLLLGRDEHGEPVAIRPFQREGVRIALLGGLWAARVLVFRSLALGARVVVHTERAGDWRGLGRWAVGRDDRLTVLEDTQPVMVAATAASPVLTVVDFGGQGGLSAASPGPWRADLTVLSQVNAAGFMAVEQADLVLAQRLSGGEAYAAQSVLRCPDSTVDMLQRLGDDMLAVLGDGLDSYLWTNPTPQEHQAFGAPTR